MSKVQSTKLNPKAPGVRRKSSLCLAGLWHKPWLSSWLCAAMPTAVLRVGKHATAPLSLPESRHHRTQPLSAATEGKRVGKLLEKRGSGVHPPLVFPVTLPAWLAPAGPRRQRGYHRKPGVQPDARRKNRAWNSNSQTLLKISLN